MDICQLLKEISMFTGTSGFEYNLSQRVAQYFSRYCDRVDVDKFSNVIGFKGGRGKGRIMVTAHIDEIGLMVKAIDEGGFVAVTKIGGVDPKSLLAAEVIIHGTEDIPGVIGAKPPHLLSPEERKKTVKLQDMYVDCAMAKDEISKYVSVGDSITVKPYAAELLGSFFASKALDNRVGFISMLVALKELENITHDSDIYFVATVQEEVHLTGGIVSSFSLSPDLAIVVDVCHGDSPDGDGEVVQKMEGGPSISIGPAFHRKFTDKILDLALRENIPLQTIAEASGRGTEVFATQISRCGIPSVLISIPLKYMHSPVEMVSTKDMAAVGRLMARFISKLTENELRQEEPPWM